MTRVSEIKAASEKPQDLRVRTRAFALRIIRLCRAIPKTAEGRVLSDQLLRSGTSVGAHYREAVRGRSTAEFVSRLNVAAQELDEAQYWMELIADAEIVAASRLTQIVDEANQLLAILVAMMKNAKRGKSEA